MSAPIVGRWAVDGEQDLPAVKALQAELTAPTALHPEMACRHRDPSVAEELLVLRADAGLDAGVPARRDAIRAYQQRFAPLGLFDVRLTFRRPDPELAAALGGLARAES